MSGISDKETCLKNTIKDLDGSYDYVIIDCPPAVGILTFNALRAATDVIVPVETGYFSLHGLSKQLETLKILSERCSQKLNVKVLASMYDIRTKMAREILAELKKHFADQMFTTVVNFNTKIKEAASFGQPISEYDPASKGKQDFRVLAQEIIGNEMKIHQHEMVNSLAGQLEAISTSADELLRTTKPQRTIPITAVSKPHIPDKIELSEKIELAAEIELVPEIELVQEEDTQQLQEEKIEKFEEKISHYYGVSQVNHAMHFVTLYPRAQIVQIAGDFNNWQPEKTPMEKLNEKGVWQAKLDLHPGRYRYRLVVDGHWQQDPYNTNNEANPFGEYNSIIEVK
jgi:chromosome partitioning protein